ncbi:restriction endonuclease subunit S [Pseudoalteromonas sp. S554]|uniref:restriction endonuclease subunit S n=1 Tax=Pseudoalteromonas sp. S554 TaxID=2066516 RepID=UPI00110CCA84|nr:restriction endonuclease subunit S [Pseudoalteromonas sp. S554]
MSWSLVKLGDICTTTQGVQITKANTKEEPYQGGYRYLYIADFMSEKKLSFVDDEFDHKKVTSNDLVMANTGSPGRVFKGKDGILSNNLFKISFDNNSVDRDYLYMMLSSNVFQSLLQKQMKGGIQKHLGHQTISRQEIPLPPLEEQKRIAAILDKADAIRHKRQQAIQLADDFLRSVFLDMFGDPKTKGWEITTVEKVAESIKGSMRTGPFGSQLLHSEFVEKGIAVLGIDNAVENKFKWGKQRFITEEKYQQLKRYTVKPDDVIITIMGTCGRCAVVPEDIPTSINTKHICCITLDKDKCLSSFLHSYFLYHPDCQKYLATNTKGAIMAGLNMGIVKGIPVPLVPLNLQVKYDSMARRLNGLSKELSEHKGSGNSLFNSLSQKAFAGEL